MSECVVCEVRSVTVSLEEKRARFEFDSRSVRLAQLRTLVEDAGFDATIDTGPFPS